jgi:hypothetical protein
MVVSHGARFIPLLARAGAHAQPSFPSVRLSLKTHWLPGCDFPRAPDRPRRLPPACSGGASRLQKGGFQTRRKSGNIARCGLLNCTEPEYPQTVLQIYDPPVLLYVRGDPEALNLPSLSIVGTRRATPYGTQMAERLGRELAARGLVIVSGKARPQRRRRDRRTPHSRSRCAGKSRTTRSRTKKSACRGLPKPLRKKGLRTPRL